MSQEMYVFPCRPETAVGLGHEVEADLESRIRATYRGLTKRAGDLVPLLFVRDVLYDVPRADLDDALESLARRPGVRFATERSDRLYLEDRAAALRLDGLPMHLIGFDPG